MRFLKRARDVALEGTGVNYGRGDDANTPIGAPGTEYKLDVEGDESESMKEKKKQRETEMVTTRIVVSRMLS